MGWTFKKTATPEELHAFVGRLPLTRQSKFRASRLMSTRVADLNAVIFDYNFPSGEEGDDWDSQTVVVFIRINASPSQFIVYPASGQRNYLLNVDPRISDSHRILANTETIARLTQPAFRKALLPHWQVQAYGCNLAVFREDELVAGSDLENYLRTAVAIANATRAALHGGGPLPIDDSPPIGPSRQEIPS